MHIPISEPIGNFKENSLKHLNSIDNGSQESIFITAIYKNKLKIVDNPLPYALSLP